MMRTRYREEGDHHDAMLVRVKPKQKGAAAAAAAEEVGARDRRPRSLLTAAAEIRYIHIFLCIHFQSSFWERAQRERFLDSRLVFLSSLCPQLFGKQTLVD